jgi:hypothetical protein
VNRNNPSHDAAVGGEIRNGVECVRQFFEPLLEMPANRWIVVFSLGYSKTLVLLDRDCHSIRRDARTLATFWRKKANLNSAF